LNDLDRRSELDLANGEYVGAQAAAVVEV